MSSEEIVRLVMSFFGGGLVAGILDWIRTSRAEKAARKVEHLNQQIRNLYGPLYLFTGQNEQMLSLSDKFHEAYTIEYVNKKWSKDGNTQASLRNETKQTIDLANTYVTEVRKNNDKVVEIIANNYAFIDPDDVEIFQKFLEDYTRLKIEINEKGQLNTPFVIYRRLGSISFMRPEFMERVKKKFTEKEGLVNQCNTR